MLMAKRRKRKTYQKSHNSINLYNYNVSRFVKRNSETNTILGVFHEMYSHNIQHQEGMSFRTLHIT